MFSNPIVEIIRDIPRIIILEDSVKGIDGLITHIDGLNINRGTFHIVILWKNEESIMTDIWIFDVKEWKGNAQIDVVNFENDNQTKKFGITASEGLSLVFSIEKKRRGTKDMIDWLNILNKNPS